MNRMDHSLIALREMDMRATGNSPVHKLHPSAKLVVTIAYIIITVSFSKYQLSGLLMMIIYPAFLFSSSGVTVGTCFRKLRFILPLVLAVGLFNPLFDRAAMIKIGNIAVSGGTISMVTLMLKGVFSLMASFLLVATTPIDDLCKSLRKIHMPKIIVSLLLLTYRYVSMFLDEVATMTESYSLRAPGQNGIAFKSWGSFLGQLIIRSMNKADRNYRVFSKLSWLWIPILIAVCVLMRLFNVPALVGSLFVR